MPDDIHYLGRYEWERVLRRCVLPQTVKTVAAFLAQYADADGTNVRPGVARLAAVSQLSERSVRGGITRLRELDLITRTRKGSSFGRQATTDEYRLSRPDDLMRRIHMLDADESPASAACDSGCVHPLSPARPAADKRHSEKEHRHVVQGTPASHAGTPASDDRNTGTTCTPPPKDQPQRPIDQRGNHLREVTTGAQCATCDSHGDFPICCQDHLFRLCPNCLRLHPTPALAQEAS